MAKSKPARIIRPPNRLKAKLGGPLPPPDEALIKRAEASLAALAPQFGEWIADNVADLEAAFAAALDSQFDDPAGAAFYRSAHDLKGLGTTYGFPIVTRLSASLSRLIGTEELRAAAPAALVKAHVDAIRAAVREQVTGDSRGIAAALAEELANQVSAALDA